MEGENTYLACQTASVLQSVSHALDANDEFSSAAAKENWWVTRNVIAMQENLTEFSKNCLAQGFQGNVQLAKVAAKKVCEISKWE